VVRFALVLVSVCCYAAETDALAISVNIQARHLPFGTILDPIFSGPNSNQIVGYTRCGDSAIWTGHYLAAEAFRYKVTRLPQALDNVKQAIAGIKSLADVTGTNLLARCLAPINSPFAAGIQSEEAANGIHTNTSAGYIWVGNTSRDQYAGVIFGLGVAYDMIDDPSVKASISQLTTRLIDFLQAHTWNVVMPGGDISTTFLVRPDEILALLQVGRQVNSNHFSTAYDIQRVLLAAEVAIPAGVDVADDASYFKFNLDYISFYNLIRLESSSAKSIYKLAYDLVRAHTAGHQNAFFDVIDRGLNGPDAARDAETLALLDAWLLRPPRDPIVDLHGAVPVCGSQACRPVPVPQRPPTDFLWQRNPFQLAGGGIGVIESAGIDYILPYWMARYYALGAAAVVRSAASGTPVVTPASIASIYGQGLASAPAQASTSPWPASLGGVTLTVRDTAGTQRAANLIYVSPGQINFAVPAGMVPGIATVTVANGTATLSADATIQGVAPALFSMNGAGSGVAAATAVRTLAGNPGPQFPIPVFQCDASGCTSVPIDVGLDTPVFLTLYGTGIRNLRALSNVNVTINGISVEVLYAGPQPDYEGLDQVNVALGLNLRGSGESNVVVTVDGQPSNTVTVNIK
jgi:uncharacterized protein (TIGR03437 family)